MIVHITCIVNFATIVPNNDPLDHLDVTVGMVHN
jgi:hypothetical protein